MKITLETDDIELLAKSLNNAYLAYFHIYQHFLFGLENELNEKWLGLLPKGEERYTNPTKIIKERLFIIKDMLNQIETIEKEIKDDNKRAEVSNAGRQVGEASD